jgi:hypothetical protein
VAIEQIIEAELTGRPAMLLGPAERVADAAPGFVELRVVRAAS